MLKRKLESSVRASKIAERCSNESVNESPLVLSLTLMSTGQVNSMCCCFTVLSTNCINFCKLCIINYFLQSERHLETLCLTGKQRGLLKGVVLLSLNFVV